MKPSMKDPAFLGALATFNAAAASQSFQAAAAELGVTPSAVSHRIAALEEAIGQRLFRRETRKVYLTQEGVEFAAATKQALSKIREAVDGLTKKRVLRVSVGPYLSSTWLMARLNQFERAYPNTRIDLIHVIGTAIPRDADVAIIWEDIATREADHHILFDTKIVPVAAPGYVSDSRFWHENVVPLHYRDRQAWRYWLKSVGAPLAFAERGEVLADPLLVFESAVHGRGIVIGFLPFVAEPLASGKIAMANETAIPADRVYTVVASNPADELSGQFIAWLFEQATASAGLSMR